MVATSLPLAPARMYVHRRPSAFLIDGEAVDVNRHSTHSSFGIVGGEGIEVGGKTAE